MSKKTKKILNGNYDIFPDNAEKFPSAFLGPEDKFVDRWASIVKKSYDPTGIDVTRPVTGIVLKVKENGKLTPGGPRDRVNMISETESPSCLKMWVHTSFDAALSVPRNFLNPGDEANLIYEHFIFESQNLELDKDIPKAGDIVQVIHPWAWGFTNKVGLYLGKFATGMAPTFESTSDKFKTPNKRKKDVPADTPPTRTTRREDEA
tara:strand:+ start:62 stop:679 length:618 start_codon:yes stop_codon:yes gene_type:complete